ncbi:MAG: hypothetical protein NT051_03500 [Candidatus Micrarchaeota archaeon]|nr:hypothetical protein [Candidatus Micrarchaeota archaeon]
MANQSDEFLGEIKGKMPMYSNGLDSSGEIILCEKGIIVRAEGNTVKAPFSYVKMLEKSADLPLGRLAAEMDVFDQLGQKHYYHFGMSDQHFIMLKKAIAAGSA